MKYTLFRITETGRVPFFTGTVAQCLWKLLRHVVNTDTVLVDSVRADDWMRSLDIKSFSYKTSVTGFTQHVYGIGTKDIRRSILRAERKFASAF